MHELLIMLVWLALSLCMLAIAALVGSERASEVILGAGVAMLLMTGAIVL